MNIQRLYIPEEIKENKTIILTNDDFHYIKNVIRLKQNDEIKIFNESCGEYLGIISQIGKKELTITPQHQLRDKNSETLNDTEIIFSSIRHTRQDILIEKITELGVKTISPIITKYTNIKNINLERLNTITKEACEQSNRLSKPKINQPQTLQEKIKSFDFTKRTLVYLDERKDIQNTIDILKNYKNKPISFLIGPEGGFSNEEFELLKTTPAISVSLGNLILRTETATIAILTLYNLGI